MNKESGWKALTGTTNFGDLSEGDLAFRIFVDRIVGFVAHYFVRLGGKVDGLVFSGGIGENSVALRSAVVKGISCLGYALDNVKNANPGSVEIMEINDQTSKRILVVKTNEQVMTNFCIQRSNWLAGNGKAVCEAQNW